MKLIETLETRTEALKVAEVAKLFGVTPQHIYRMAVNGSIPSFRISGSVRFDPDEVAAWLKEKQAPAAASRRIGSASIASPMGREIIYSHATVTCVGCALRRGKLERCGGATTAARNPVILGLWNVAIDGRCQLAK